MTLQEFIWICPSPGYLLKIRPQVQRLYLELLGRLEKSQPTVLMAGWMVNGPGVNLVDYATGRQGKHFKDWAENRLFNWDESTLYLNSDENDGEWDF
jgi:hypothetical protein